jgi:hypothetical protein
MVVDMTSEYFHHFIMSTSQRRRTPADCVSWLSIRQEPSVSAWLAGSIRRASWAAGRRRRRADLHAVEDGTEALLVETIVSNPKYLTQE